MTFFSVKFRGKKLKINGENVKILEFVFCFYVGIQDCFNTQIDNAIEKITSMHENIFSCVMTKTNSSRIFCYPDTK